MPQDELRSVLIKAQHNVASNHVRYAPMKFPKIMHEYVVLLAEASHHRKSEANVNFSFFDAQHLGVLFYIHFARTASWQSKGEERHGYPTHPSSRCATVPQSAPIARAKQSGHPGVALMAPGTLHSNKSTSLAPSNPGRFCL